MYKSSVLYYRLGIIILLSHSIRVPSKSTQEASLPLFYHPSTAVYAWIRLVPYIAQQT